MSQSSAHRQASGKRELAGPPAHVVCVGRTPASSRLPLAFVPLCLCASAPLLLGADVSGRDRLLSQAQEAFDRGTQLAPDESHSSRPPTTFVPDSNTP